jgi:hypothetical protein
MRQRGAPSWLAAFQRDFGAMLRTPLDRSSGTLAAEPERYGAGLVAAARAGPMVPATERLATYNRQYWFRLFTVLQAEYPLTTAIVGAWNFNDLATRFLLVHPPVTRDLGDVAMGFSAYLDEALPPEAIRLAPSGRMVPRAAITEAATIDAAFRDVVVAPPQTELRLSDAEASGLADVRLDPSLATAMLEEHWPLVELRRAIRGRGDEGPCELPAPHPDGARHWLLCRVPRGERVIPLTSTHARLLELLRAHPVGRALAMLEAEHPAIAAVDLASDVQRWLAQGMALGLWRGVLGGGR